MRKIWNIFFGLIAVIIMLVIFDLKTVSFGDGCGGVTYDFTISLVDESGDNIEGAVVYINDNQAAKSAKYPMGSGYACKGNVKAGRLDVKHGDTISFFVTHPDYKPLKWSQYVNECGPSGSITWHAYCENKVMIKKEMININIGGGQSGGQPYQNQNKYTSDEESKSYIKGVDECSVIVDLKVFDKSNNQPIPNATVMVSGNACDLQHPKELGKYHTDSSGYVGFYLPNHRYVNCPNIPNYIDGFHLIVMKEGYGSSYQFPVDLCPIGGNFRHNVYIER